MKLYGLIGYPLGHSFSRKYFTEKFRAEGIDDARYELFEISEITQLRSVIESFKELKGLNVTIPYKESVIPLLDKLSPSAEKVGAVNVINFEGDKLVGYNSDYYGFRDTLEPWLPTTKPDQALVLGSGGASKAVCSVLTDLEIPFAVVSRTPGKNKVTYDSVTDLEDWKLIINTTPLGMHPNTDTAPPLPYATLTDAHFLYDLVYNPLTTLFMKKGTEKGATVTNGLRMLHLQAEKAWDIWNR